MKRSLSGPWPRWSVLAALAGLTGGGGGIGCQSDLPLDLPEPTGRFAGQVVVSGGLRGAEVSVDQLDLTTGEVRFHVGDTVTDVTGHFSLETGSENGVFLVRARGGAYRDLATGATVHLDETDELRSLVWHDLLDLQDDALVSPIGHMIEARTRAHLAVSGDMWPAYLEATGRAGRSSSRRARSTRAGPRSRSWRSTRPATRRP